MPKFLTFLFVALTTIGLSHNTQAQVQYKTPKEQIYSLFRVVSFDDYYPLGTYDTYKYITAFDDFMQYFAQRALSRVETFRGGDYLDTLQRANKGDADVILGVYSDTAIYSNFKIIYPAAIDNPVHLVMLPNRIGEIKKLADLKNLKGAVHGNEHWNDFVANQLKQFNIETVDNSYDLYGKLLKGEIDYIFTTYWFGTVEMLKLGVRDLVSISKKSIWNMPVFIAISKASNQREYLSHYLTQRMSEPEIREKIKQRVMDMLKKVEEENRGTVPPAYTLNNPNI